MIPPQSHHLWKNNGQIQCEKFRKTAAILEDGSTAENSDVVVFPIGYTCSFPFFEDSVNITDDQISLYHQIFPLHLENPTLALIGLIQPIGMVRPSMEHQGRWPPRV